MVSACLLGLSTRYKGDSKPCPIVAKFLRYMDLVPIPVCPEQLGGLPTPRPPSTFVGADGVGVLQQQAHLLDHTGNDTTQAFIRGAQQCLDIARLCQCEWAIFKERSPSCGVHQVYTGETRIQGRGVTTALLLREGVRVISETEVSTFQD
jgi:uncharacterized protein YbbK (DUF523 family)